MNNIYNGDPSMDNFGQSDGNNSFNPTGSNTFVEDPTIKEFSQFSNDNFVDPNNQGSTFTPTTNDFVQLDSNPEPATNFTNENSLNEFYQEPKPVSESPIPGIDPFGGDAPIEDAPSTSNMGYSEPVQPGFNPNMGYSEPIQDNFGPNVGYNEPVQDNFNQNVGFGEPMQQSFDQNTGFGEPVQSDLTTNVGYSEPIQQNFGQNVDPDGFGSATLPSMNNSQMVYNQEMPSYQPNEEVPSEKKNNKTVTIIIAIIVGLVVACVSYYVVSGLLNNSKNPEKEYQKILIEREKEKEKLTKNVTIKDSKLKDGNILVEITNNNSKTVFYNGIAEFYDADNKLINTEDIYAIVGANDKYYGLVFIESGNENYTSYKISNKSASETVQIEDKKNVTYETNKTDDLITILYKNNSSNKLDAIYGIMLFYDENNVLVAASVADEYDIEANSTASAKVFLPVDEKLTKVPFDRFELIINSATHK